jgi:peptide/nickel transport system substrate-binding protein
MGCLGWCRAGAGSDFGLHPVGSGPYRFVSQVQDKEVVLERFRGMLEQRLGGWRATGDDSRCRSREIERMQFNVVPDTITSALELQKGSADAASNVLTPDMVYALRGAPGLETASGPGSNVWYLNFNVQDRVLRDKRVRQAVALAMDKPAIVAALWRGMRGWRTRCCRRTLGAGERRRTGAVSA